jgi:ankyrin repeat protein
MIRRITTLAPELASEGDANGKTPFHFAVNLESWMGMSSVMQVLLNAGANVMAKDKNGNTPLHILLGHKFFISKSTNEVDAKGVDWTARNNEGETLLHVAVQREDSLYEEGRRVVTVKYLMGKGLDPMTEDKECRTVLDAAASVAADDVLAMFGRES